MSLFSSGGYNRTELLSQAARARARGRRKKAVSLYLRVLDADGTKVLVSTEQHVRWNASPLEHFEIDVPES